jgi:putative transposase
VSEASFDVWKKKYGHLETRELRHVRQLEEENARLKRVVADLTPDKHILRETIRRNR